MAKLVFGAWRKYVVRVGRGFNIYEDDHTDRLLV